MPIHMHVATVPAGSTRLPDCSASVDTRAAVLTGCQGQHISVPLADTAAFHSLWKEGPREGHRLRLRRCARACIAKSHTIEHTHLEATKHLTRAAIRLCAALSCLAISKMHAHYGIPSTAKCVFGHSTGVCFWRAKSTHYSHSAAVWSRSRCVLFCRAGCGS